MRNANLIQCFYKFVPRVLTRVQLFIYNYTHLCYTYLFTVHDSEHWKSRTYSRIVKIFSHLRKRTKLSSDAIKTKPYQSNVNYKNAGQQKIKIRHVGEGGGLTLDWEVSRTTESARDRERLRERLSMHHVKILTTSQTHSLLGTPKRKRF